LRAESIALNYAEALFALAEPKGAAEEYGEWLEAVAGAVSTSPDVEAVLMSPRVTKAQKSRIVAAALPQAPKPFVLFLQSVIRRGRQGLFAEMSQAYLGLLDKKLSRVRASVTTARPADAKLQKEIVEALTRVSQKEVLARFGVDPALLGGVVVRIGDRIYDGSLRRKVTALRRQLLAH
jgi:F-type H+-transporting ATPase subunit delta